MRAKREEGKDGERENGDREPTERSWWGRRERKDGDGWVEEDRRSRENNGKCGGCEVNGGRGKGGDMETVAGRWGVAGARSAHKQGEPRNENNENVFVTKDCDLH